MMGSLGFMPLEVLTSISLIADPAHDVFSLAAILWLICAKPAMKRRNMFTHEV